MSGRKSKNRGKSFENAVADYLGFTRAHYKQHDLEGDFITVECKKRGKLPKSITDWYAQAVAARRDNTYPIVVMGELNGKTKDALVLLSLEDFSDLLDCQTF